MTGCDCMDSTPSPRTRQEWALLAAILLLTGFIYGQTLWFPFVNFDDDVHVYRNPHVRSGLSLDNLVWAFEIHGPSQWHPLAWISHQVDSQLFGAAADGAHAGGHHAVNLLLHLCNVVLVYATFRRLLGRGEPALLSAALFAVHPLNVESVAWVSERRNLLCLLFSLSAVLAYANYARRESWSRYLAVCGLLTAALMAKPLAVTLPCVFWLLDLWPLQRWSKSVEVDSSSALVARIWQRWLPHVDKLPLLALSAVAGVLTILCQEADGIVSSLDALPFDVRILNALAAYGQYLLALVWPIHLAVFYPHPSFVGLDPWDVLLAPAVGGAVALLLVTLFAIVVRHRWPCWIVGWLWFVGTLVPMIGLVQSGMQQRADRYVYLPMLGVLLAVTGSLPWKRWQSAGARRGLMLVASLVVLLLAGRTWDQVKVWSDSATLFEQTLAVDDRNHWAHLNAGLARQERGEWEAAFRHYEAALTIDPQYALAHYNMGVLLAERGDLRGSASHISEAVRLNPKHADSWVRLGTMHGFAGRLDLAEQAFRTALEVDVEHVDAWFNLGVIYEHQGDLRRAREAYQTALRIDPLFRPARDKLGKLPAGDGKPNR
jgi:protein O-mannosyl-transferase